MDRYLGFRFLMGWTTMSWKILGHSNPADVRHLCAIDLPLANINSDKSMAPAGVTSIGATRSWYFSGHSSLSLRFYKKGVGFARKYFMDSPLGQAGPIFLFSLQKHIMWLLTFF